MAEVEHFLADFELKITSLVTTFLVSCGKFADPVLAPRGSKSTSFLRPVHPKEINIIKINIKLICLDDIRLDLISAAKTADVY